jgi:SAM-dependent methyltransferase/uncharacterized protein YbaR (Trm112 family)
MRAELVEILKCLRCGAEGLQLKNAGHDGREVVSGSVACRECGLEYKIEDGILDALVFPDPTVAAAREAFRRSKSLRTERSPEDLARRGHLDREYLKDSEANFYQMLEGLEPSNGWAVDIGAGTGWTTAGLAGQGYRAVAVDISADHKLELARHHFVSGFIFDRVLADMNHLPFRDSSFSLVFSSAALHHSSDLRVSLDEISRTTALGGRLELINEPVLGILERFLPGRGHLEAEDGVLENHYSYSVWRKTLKGAGIDGRAKFPESIASRLASGDFSRRHKFYRIAKSLAGLWSIKLARVLLKKVLFQPGISLMGLPLCYSGRKIRGSINA